MSRAQFLSPLISMFLLFSTSSHAQLWNGVINPSRAINWSNAGFAVPNRTTQCGSTIAPYGTSGTPAAPTTINNAIAACPAGEFVSLGAGTFYLNSGINFSVNNVTLRGQGANQTFVILKGAGGCNGMYSAVCMAGSNNYAGGENNVCDWSSGYAPGTTTITLAKCGSTTPAAGSISNLKIGSVLVLDQLDEGTDTGFIWNCNGDNQPCIGGSGAHQGGFQRTDGPCNSSICTRGQQQVVVVTSISGLNITVSPGVYMANWRSGQKPQAWFPTTTITGDGVEDFSIDVSGSNGTSTFVLNNAYECWMKGMRSVVPARAHIQTNVVKNLVVENNYFYQGQSHGAVSYGAEFDVASDNLYLNNICQQETDSCPNNNGGAEGNVFAYNFAIDDVNTTAGWFIPSSFRHAGGDAFNLDEGNISVGYEADDIHGTHHLATIFRGYYEGNQNAGCGGAAVNTCNAQTTPMNLYASNRYLNVIGNVLGDPSRTQITVYQYDSAATGDTHNCTGTGGCYAIYTMGYNDNSGWSSNSGTAGAWCATPACSSFVAHDPQTSAYLLRWGNWDSVTNAVRFCGNSSDTGWSTTCASTSEIPISLPACSFCNGTPSFSNAVPTLGDTGTGQSAMPASFYYSSQPSFLTGRPWPLIGPDVTSGNLGICSGGTYAHANATMNSDCTPGGGTLVAAFGGHANSNPAMECFLHVMGGPPDGTGSALSFNESSCYGADPSQPPPQGLAVQVH
jgi:hypothetical protein